MANDGECLVQKDGKTFYLLVGGRLLRLCKKCYEKRLHRCDGCQKEVLDANH